MRIDFLFTQDQPLTTLSLRIYVEFGVVEFSTFVQNGRRKKRINNGVKKETVEDPFFLSKYVLVQTDCQFVRKKFGFRNASIHLLDRFCNYSVSVDENQYAKYKRNMLDVKTCVITHIYQMGYHSVQFQ